MVEVGSLRSAGPAPCEPSTKPSPSEWQNNAEKGCHHGHATADTESRDGVFAKDVVSHFRTRNEKINTSATSAVGKTVKAHIAHPHVDM